MTWPVDVLIVGAGFAGAVAAERLASEYGLECLVIDARGHLGGTSHDGYDRAGVLTHTYGPHYFRTNSDRVREYLSAFTSWRAVEYRALAFAEGRYWPFPINLDTFEQLIGRPSTEAEMRATLESWREPIADVRNSEQRVVSEVGRRLFDLFYAGYTRKQWGREARELHPSVCARIPVRYDRDRRYLSESFQALPADGYTRLFERLLSHRRIRLLLQTDFQHVRHSVSWRHLIWTGPLDALYDYRFGPLEYRSLTWERETIEAEFFQPEMQVNYPNDNDFTRILEAKHATGQRLPVTTIVREYPAVWAIGKDPYYAVPTPSARGEYARYRALADADPGLTVLGRLASYENYNMDQVTAQALVAMDSLGPRLAQRSP
jgi:UDP-galactopyranose mutase